MASLIALFIWVQTPLHSRLRIPFHLLQQGLNQNRKPISLATTFAISVMASSKPGTMEYYSLTASLA
jgi:hypothetical protein